MDPIQYIHSTALFREMNLLRSARTRFQEQGVTRPLRVLSFGCSIGEEIATIKWIFPDAEIVGCDVVDSVLDIARRSVGHMATIIRSDERLIAELGPYDLITACSVLCLNPQPKDFAARFPPSRFDDTLGFLDSVLRPGGLVGIVNASYRFIDSPVTKHYQTVRSDLVNSSGFIDVMDRSGRHLLTASSGYATSFLRKAAHFKPADDEELADSLFQKRGEAGHGPEWVIVGAPPADLITLDCFDRISTDGSAAPDDAIRVKTRHRMARNPATGNMVLARQVSWKSLVHDGEHVRPEAC